MFKVEAVLVKRLASLGYAVFPCANPLTDNAPIGKRGKRPLTANGVDDATSDVSQIDAWAEQFPNANIGVRCRNCLVLDLDTKDGKNGIADIATISAELGGISATSIARTGSGGMHLFFAKTAEDIVAKTGVLWKGSKTGIDIRCGSTYIIAPPSLHENGSRYEWLKPLVPPEQLAPLPQLWIDKFLPKRNLSEYTALNSPLLTTGSNDIDCCQKYLDKLEPLQQGGRNDGIYRVAAIIFWDFGLSQSEGFPILAYFNSTKVFPPLSEPEITRAMNRVFDRDHKEPRGRKCSESKPARPSYNVDISGLITNFVNPAPTESTHCIVYPWREFPTHLLTSFSAQYVREVAQANCCDESGVGLAVLVAMSAAIGNARWITVKKGWKHPAMMWGILIGKAGTVKTWALNPAVVPLQKRQDLYHAKYRHELRKWNAEKAEYSRLSPAQKRYAPLPNNNPPLLLRILSKEGTPEKMIQNCADSPHGFLIHSDEMKTFVGSFDAYKANAKTLKCRKHLLHAF